jgi:hypothetical protein
MHDVELIIYIWIVQKWYVGEVWDAYRSFRRRSRLILWKESCRDLHRGLVVVVLMAVDVVVCCVEWEEVEFVFGGILLMKFVVVVVVVVVAE